jgi:glycosyltransferase involved in cell wall biosynthesis
MAHFRLPLMLALKKEGYNIKAIAPWDASVKKLNDAGFPLLQLHHMRRQGKNPVKDLRLIQEIRRLYSREGIDLALQFTFKPNIYGSLAASVIRTKTISTITGLGYNFIVDGLSSRVAKHLYRRAFRKCDRVIFQNPDDRALLGKLGIYPPENALIIPGSGVDIEHFRPRPQVKQEGMRFLFAGRLLIHKGIREYLQAAKTLSETHPDWEFAILGKTDHGNPSSLPAIELYRYTQKYKSIKYLGPKDDIRPDMAKADVYVLPSYREGLPMTILEAMAMGKPVITTDVPGCNMCVDHGENGWLVRPRFVAGLVEAMISASQSDAKDLLEMGERSREKVVHEFSLERVVRAYMEEIDQLLGR